MDTQLGFRLVGIEGSVVHERKEFLRALEAVMHNKDVDIVLITSKLIALAPEIISELKLKQNRPLLTEIPDRHGSVKIGELIDEYVSSAIGVKM